MDEYFKTLVDTIKAAERQTGCELSPRDRLQMAMECYMRIAINAYNKPKEGQPEGMTIGGIRVTL
jgi:hypothetical protein